MCALFDSRYASRYGCGIAFSSTCSSRPLRHSVLRRQLLATMFVYKWASIPDAPVFLFDTRGSQKSRARLARAARSQGLGQDHPIPVGKFIPSLYLVAYTLRPDHIALAPTGCVSACPM